MSAPDDADHGRSLRTKAAELAAMCWDGSEPGARLMSLCVFFEIYIGDGADETERKMRMLTSDVRSRKARANWRVIAGGNLGKTGL